MLGCVNHFHWHRKSDFYNIFSICTHMAWISYFSGTCKMCLMGDIKVRVYYSLSGNVHLSDCGIGILVSNFYIPRKKEKRKTKKKRKKSALFLYLQWLFTRILIYPLPEHNLLPVTRVCNSKRRYKVHKKEVWQAESLFLHVFVVFGVSIDRQKGFVFSRETT